MSFQVHARNARDGSRPINHRHSSFRSCVQLYRWLIRSGFRETYEWFASASGLAELSDARIRSAMDALETERGLFLDRLTSFDARRIQEKRLGRRGVTQAEVNRLYQRDFFVTGDRALPPAD